MKKNTVKKLERMAREFAAMYSDFSDGGPGLVALRYDTGNKPAVHIESPEKLAALFPGVHPTEEVKKTSAKDYTEYVIMSNGVRFFARKD